MSNTPTPEAEPAAGAPIGGELVELETPDSALITALAKAQARFPVIPKGNTAVVKSTKGEYSYSYADLGDVLAAVRPVLAEEGLAIVQTTATENGKSVLYTELRHPKGGRIVSEVELGQSSSNPQQFGGALTYLRRYELVTLLGIAAEEDRDAQDVDVPGRQPPPAELPAWAKATTDGRKQELAAELVPLIGRERTIALLNSVKGSLGGVPDVVIATAKLVAGLVIDTPADELAAGIRTIQDARHDAAEAAKATTTQTAAEAPDQPAPEPAADPPAPEDPPAPTAAEVAEAAARAAGGLDDVAQEAPADVEVDPPAEAEEAKPAAGTVEVDVEDLSAAKAAEALLRAGCTCPNPLAKDPDLDDGCPVKGHGIPF